MADPAAFAFSTAVELVRAFRTGALRPSELAAWLLDQIEARREENIFITVTRARAMEEARASDARYAKGQPASELDGVPIAWKDLFDMAGEVTTAGSALLASSPPATEDADAVRKLCLAGMVTLGKVNTSEFAYSGLGLNPHFGTPVNPNDKRVHRSPGGSSSGSGVVVAGGLACCAIGTDTGGSIRVPASFNGVVGLKTSTGRIGRGGMFNLSRSMDTVGPLARSVEDCALLFRHLLGAGAPEMPLRQLDGLVLLCPTNLVCDRLEPAIAENFERSLARLQDHGVRIRREEVPALTAVAELTERHGNLVAAEAYMEHLDLVESPTVARIDRRVVKRILGGKKMSALDVLTIQRERLRLRALLSEQLAGAIMVMPTTPITAPAIAPLEADDDLFHKVNLRTLRNVSLGNALDVCALALPNGRDSAGLPTSLLLTATHGADEELLAFGMLIEKALATEPPIPSPFCHISRSSDRRIV